MSKKVYKTSRVQQLIDLNEDLTNFKLRFNLSSKNGEEFDMAIADQYTIDNSPEEIVFKKVKNTISGSIVSDKDIFQNHFLILKSSGENQAEVEVSINKQEIPPNPEAIIEKNQRESEKDNDMREQDMREQDMREQDMRGGRDMRGRDMREQDMREQDMREQDMREQDMRGGRDMRGRDMRERDMRENSIDKQFENYEEEKTTWIDIRLIIVVLICILGGIFVYNIITKKSGITTSLATPSITEVVAPPVVSPLPSSFSFTPNMSLLNKLNSNIPLGR